MPPAPSRLLVSSSIYSSGDDDLQQIGNDDLQGFIHCSPLEQAMDNDLHQLPYYHALLHTPSYSPASKSWRRTCNTEDISESTPTMAQVYKPTIHNKRSICRYYKRTSNRNKKNLEMRAFLLCKEVPGCIPCPCNSAVVHHHQVEEQSVSQSVRRLCLRMNM